LPDVPERKVTTLDQGAPPRSRPIRSGAALAVALLFPLLACDGLALRSDPEARGASLSGTPTHSVRLPGFVSSIEVLFGLPDERLSI